MRSDASIELSLRVILYILPFDNDSCSVSAALGRGRLYERKDSKDM